MADLLLQLTRTIALSVGRGVIEASGQLVGSGAELLQSAAGAGADAVLGIAGGADGVLGVAAGSVGAAAGEAAGAVGSVGRRATERAGRAVGGLLGRNDVESDAPDDAEVESADSTVDIQTRETP